MDNATTVDVLGALQGTVPTNERLMKRSTKLENDDVDGGEKQGVAKQKQTRGFAHRSRGTSLRGATAVFMDACFDALLDVAPSTHIHGSLQPRHGRAAHAFTRDGGITQRVFCPKHLEQLVPDGAGKQFTSRVEPSRAPRAMPGSETSARAPDVRRVGLTLQHEQRVVAAFALQRTHDELPYSWSECERLERLGHLMASAVVAQIDLMDAQCELAVVRSIGSGLQTYLLFDREKQLVLWGSDQTHPVNWSRDVDPCELSMVRSAETLLVARSNDDLLPTPLPAPFGFLVAASPVSTETPFGSGCAVMGFRVMEDGGGAILHLSEQERMVARLLVRGYQPVNIAARTGVSENTVRTYIRRIYKKLRVSSRADLVRMLLTEG